MTLRQPWRARMNRPSLVLGTVALLVTLAYLAASRAGGVLGFPLDDAWIHQTYARNLGQLGQFAFVPGQPSAGSTSPAWTALLALGYLLRLDFRAWAYLLGAGLLALNAWLAYGLARRYWPDAPGVAWAAGLFVALEWHLGWAAASGMETLLFSALALLTFWLHPTRQSVWLGLTVGLSLLVRPDGLLLLPFALARVWLAPGRTAGRGGPPPAHVAQRRVWPPWWRRRPGQAQGPAPTIQSDHSLWTGLLVLAGFSLVFLPYLAFNQWLAGTPWPNTFYAKQAEYAALLAVPLWQRLVQVGVLPLVGAQALLIPGIFGGLWASVQRRHWDLVLPLAWAAAMVGAYAVRLPVTYQHGRYLIPIIPVLVVLGTGGLARMLQWQSARLLPRVASRAWLAATSLLVLAFVLLGAQAYTRDVQIIETEMVAAARWINANTAAEARVAAHDIGALGYYGQRALLDLAGLISPEVIPFIRDEARLAAWLTNEEADYLMTFPGWYPGLVQRTKSGLEYQTGAPYSPAAGGENMTVYRWQAVLP